MSIDPTLVPALDAIHQAMYSMPEALLAEADARAKAREFAADDRDGQPSAFETIDDSLDYLLRDLDTLHDEAMARRHMWEAGVLSQAILWIERKSGG